MPSGLRRFRTQVRDLALLAGANLYQLQCPGLLLRLVRAWRADEAKRTTHRFLLRPTELTPVLVRFTGRAGVASGLEEGDLVNLNRLPTGSVEALGIFEFTKNA